MSTSPLDLVESAPRHLFFTGKGGVGKTALACATALGLAARGRRVLLVSTDPASNLDEMLGVALGPRPTPVPGATGLEALNLDPNVAAEAYRERVLAPLRGRASDADVAKIREELSGACTTEIAAFDAFAGLLAGDEDAARFDRVVFDTAPTGHTLLLLDATGAYHRDVLRGVDQTTGSRLVTPLMRLRDPAYTRVLLVTLPETTPVSEAAQLQQDLRRAQVEPFAWVINASLAAARPRDPLLVARVAAELAQIRRVTGTLARRVAVVPWSPDEPVGEARLRSLVGPASEPAAASRAAPAGA